MVIVKTLFMPGRGVADLEVAAKRFWFLHPHMWSAPDGTWLRYDGMWEDHRSDEPGEFVWQVRVDGDFKRCACIRAYEAPRGLTADFIDGYYFSPIDDAHHVGPAFFALADALEALLSTAPTPEATAKPQKSGPRAETIRKAWLFKAIKDKHPGWSYARVALEATCNEASPTIGEPREYTRHDVENAYASMGWDWEPQRRIR
jgi:hypothetical protein